MRLKFSHPAEFLNELRQSPPNLEPVLRTTVRHQLDSATGAFRHLTVVATYVRALAGRDDPVPLLVLLERYVGEDWGPGFKESDATRQRTEAILAELRTAASELELEFRPGYYDPSALRP